MKLIIAGSRNINEYNLINKAIAFAGIDVEDITEIVSGCAKGIDSLAVAWAKNHGIPVCKMPADWSNLEADPCLVKTNQYGDYNALAGLVRNKEMGQYADALLAIWDGESRGTKQMIEYMEELSKQFWVYEL